MLRRTYAWIVFSKFELKTIESKIMHWIVKFGINWLDFIFKENTYWMCYSKKDFQVNLPHHRCRITNREPYLTIILTWGLNINLKVKLTHCIYFSVHVQIFSNCLYWKCRPFWGLLLSFHLLYIGKLRLQQQSVVNFSPKVFLGWLQIDVKNNQFTIYIIDLIRIYYFSVKYSSEIFETEPLE